MRKLFAAVITLCIACTSFATELRLTLPGRDDLVLNLPDGWRSQVQRPRSDLPPTITLRSATPLAFEVLITPIWPVGNAQKPTSSGLEALVRNAADSASAQAVESKLTVVKLAAAGGVGFYFSATDRAPEPDGYKFLTQGALGQDELLISFTILNNESGKAAVPAALNMLGTMRRGKAL